MSTTAKTLREMTLETVRKNEAKEVERAQYVAKQTMEGWEKKAQDEALLGRFFVFIRICRSENETVRASFVIDEIRKLLNDSEIRVEYGTEYLLQLHW